EVAAGGEVPILVEDAVVRQEALAVDVPDVAVGEDEARVVEIRVEVRCADERRDAAGRRGDLLHGGARCANEARAEQEVLGWVARDGELREEDEVGALAACAAEPVDDLQGVACEVTDDAVDLCECEPHASSMREVVRGATR